MKAVSANYRCALIYDSNTPALKTYDFSLDGTVTVSKTVAASLYTGIDWTLTTNKFDISDDCSALRINNKIAHYYLTTTAYV